MKKLITALICTIVLISVKAQEGWLRQNTTYGLRYYRGAFDSTLLFPAMNGVPSGIASLKATDPMHLPGIIGDTANKEVYVFWAKDSTWSKLSTTTISGESGTATVDYYVEDSTNTPPVVFPEGFDTVYYLIGGLPDAGPWTGQAYKIARYVNEVLDGFITPTTSYRAQTLDDLVWHRYNGSTWPITYARPWLDNGNQAGGVFGSRTAQIVYMRYNNVNKMLITGPGIRLPQENGTGIGIATLTSTGLIQRREPPSSSDTTNNKPLISDASGNIYRSTSWFGSGGSSGGGEDLDETMELGSVLSETRTIDFTGFGLNLTGQSQDISIDDTWRLAAVDSISVTSLATVDIQAGTALKLFGATLVSKGSTSASFGFGIGATVTEGWNTSTSGTFCVGCENLTGTATIKQAVLDTITGLIGWQNTSSGVPLTSTYIGHGDPSNLLTGSPNFTYASSVVNILRTNIATTSTNALVLSNSQAATSGNPQYSPRLIWHGQLYNASNQALEFGAEVTTEATGSATGHLVFTSSTNGAAFSSTPLLAIESNGSIGINTATSNLGQNGLDITPPAGGNNALVLRDNTGVATFRIAINGTGNATVTSSGGAGITAGGFFGQLNTLSSGSGASNFYALSGVSIGNGAGSSFAGSSNGTAVRIYSQPTTSTVAASPTNQNYATMMLASAVVTEASSGTADWYSHLVVKPLSITNGSATLTRAATVIFEGPSTGTGAPSGFSNETFLVYSGISRFNGAMRFAYVAKTGTYTATTTDYFIDCTSNSFTVSLPAASTCTGVVYIIMNSGSSTTITVDPDASETINGATTEDLTTQYSYTRVMSDGANWKKF